MAEDCFYTRCSEVVRSNKRDAGKCHDRPACNHNRIGAGSIRFDHKRVNYSAHSDAGYSDRAYS